MFSVLNTLASKFEVLDVYKLQIGFRYHFPLRCWRNSWIQKLKCGKTHSMTGDTAGRQKKEKSKEMSGDDNI